MLTGIVIVLTIIIGGIAGCIIWNRQKEEIKKYYDAADRMVKENCLDNAIRSKCVHNYGGKKTMIYLKWKDRKKKQGFVFDPEAGVRIGRTPGINEICVQEERISGRHCQIFLSGGQLAIQDMNSTNGTWIRRGLRKHPVEGAEYLFSDDKIIVGSLKITVTVFIFDTSYI